MTQEENRAKNSEVYVNRELSWLKFNIRVLEEAEDETVPLYERLKFVSCLLYTSEEYFARYSLLLERSKRQVITLLHENVVRTKSRDLDLLVRLSKALPEARFVLDVKQAIRSDVSPIEFMKKLGPAVEHIHFSDHNDAQDCLPVGKGNMDLNNFFHKMLLNTNCHSVILELYRSSFKNVENLVESRCV